MLHNHIIMKQELDFSKARAAVNNMNALQTITVRVSLVLQTAQTNS